MKYLNLGCGTHYVNEKIWTNLDFVSTGEGVIAHNLLSGIPFIDQSFDLVYHSHVLEHFSKIGGYQLLGECYRVLKKGGVIRIAIPDLERIVKTYLNMLEAGVKDENNELIRANYDWMMIEMYDQVVRTHGGGEMANYLFQDQMINEEFVYDRIGEEGKWIRNYFLNQPPPKPHQRTLKYLFKAALHRFKKLKTPKQKENAHALNIGKFRLQGEIHQWMYDRYSLQYILKKIGFHQVEIRDAFNSYNADWATFNLDGKDGQVRKPDSLFIEAIKN